MKAKCMKYKLKLLGSFENGFLRALRKNYVWKNSSRFNVNGSCSHLLIVTVLITLCFSINFYPQTARAETNFQERCSSEGARNSKGAICLRGYWQFDNTNNSKKKSKNSGDPYQDCISAAQSVKATCSSESINDSAAEYSENSNNDADVMSTKKSGIAEQCQQNANAANKANDTISGIIGSCEEVLSDCSRSCAKVSASSLSADKKKSLDEARKACSSGYSDLANLKSDSEKVTAKRDQSQKCVKDSTNKNGFEMPQMPTSSDSGNACEKNPDSAECGKLKQDCSNPEFAAGNEVCKCLSGGCKSTVQATAPNISTASGSQDYANDSQLGDQVSGNDGATASNSTSGLNVPQGGSGGGPSGGNGGGANTPGLNYEDPESSVDTNVNGGKMGGSGYSLQGAHTAPVGPGSGSYSQVGSWIPPKLKDVDTDKFRPNWKRNPAAQDVAASGPLLGSSVNMWHKISQTYCQKSQSLVGSQRLSCQ